MEKYESNQQSVRRPVEQIYAAVSNFENFTPIVQDKVEGWSASENECSFLVKGMRLNLMIIDKEPNDYVKISGGDASPIDFTFWIQMKQAAPYDTRFRLVLHAKLNMMMKMMVGSKLRKGIDQMAEQMAKAFNGEFNMEDIEKFTKNNVPL